MAQSSKIIRYLIIFMSFAILTGFYWRDRIFKPLKQQKTLLKVGICCGEPPYEYLDKYGQVQGINKQVVEQAIKSEELSNLKIQWHVLPFGEAFLALDQGKIDFLATFLHINEERKKRYDFSIISNSYIVFVGRRNQSVQNAKKTLYGLQSEAIFERQARNKNVKYKGYPQANDLFINFDLEKVNAMIIDIKTLKHLIGQNYQKICISSPVSIKNKSKYSSNIIRIKNKNSNFYDSSRKYQGILGSKLSGIVNKKKPVRVYNSPEDLIIAFRSGGVYKIILEAADYSKLAALMALSINYKTEGLDQWLAANKKPGLKLSIYKQYKLITRRNNPTPIKKCGIIKNQRVGALGKYGYSQLQDYEDMDKMLIDLLKGEIDGIILHDLTIDSLSVKCEIANIFYRSERMENGFAFSKTPTGRLSTDLKQKIILAIEKAAANNKDLTDSRELQENS